MKPGYKRIDSDFLSDGIRCAGWLYLPEGETPLPVLIIAHGLAAHKTFRLPDYAERFLQTGIAVFTFDYRFLGASDGQPKNVINPFYQVKDLKAAIRHVRKLPKINKDKIVLWGTSLGGGHVITASVDDLAIKAVIAQVPFLDVFSTMPLVGIRHCVRSIAVGFKDLLNSLIFKKTSYVPVIGKPDTFACMNTHDAKSGYLSIIPEECHCTWENKCAARFFLALLFYRPLSLAHRVKCPCLLVAAQKDSLIAPSSVQKASKKIEKATLVWLPIHHFEIYTGSGFEQAVSIEIEFLKEHI